ncbi:hypothetical protein BCUN_1173 [Bifidobacterium cuniculi]|uniref:Uncharacterized protein n=1 Tax=Bifidobacterium cuniculi TaxID=1688 RepID=A0A087AWU4_9BIFI|nr:hypothetical protein BCUN_1173 [Bifidobacterium cuniculi]
MGLPVRSGNAGNGVAGPDRQSHADSVPKFLFRKMNNFSYGCCAILGAC